MRSQFDDGGQGPDLAEVLAQVSDTVRRYLKRFGPLVALALLVLLGVAGFYQVEPGEKGVVRTFGRHTASTDPGLHFRIPIVQQVDKVNMQEIQRIEVGFRGEEKKLVEARMLTGDENIVEAQMIVQYRITDPVQYLFRLKDPEETLRNTAEVALRSVVGRTTIDDVITTGRGQVQSETKTWLQRLMTAYQSGLTITEVKLQAVDPPDEVKEAFHDVVRAREEKEKLINQARGYNEDILPRARGEAEKMKREAEAYKKERVVRAEGDAKKFESVLAEYSKAPQVTRQRLYLETMERLLARVQHKTILDRTVGKNAVPVLPLGGHPAPAPVAPAPAGGE
jgi:membrane protease subunit HflK